MISKYVQKKISGTWKEKHESIINNFLINLNLNTNKYILKGGTALMECYDLHRFSEDIDLDSNDKLTIFKFIEKYCKDNSFVYRIAKKTNTVSRFMIDYGGKNEKGNKPLKIEISHRMASLYSNVKKINGIVVYPIDRIAEMKAEAYLSRDKIRDLYDLTYIYNEKIDSLNEKTIQLIRDVISQKGLEQFDYLISTQSEDLIDIDDLANNFLKMFNSLGLLSDDDLLDDNDLLEKNISLCKDNPLNLKDIPLNEQNEEIIKIACETCRNTQGVSPSDLLHYIRDDLKVIVTNYRGYWGINPYTGQYTWYNY